MLRIPFYTVRFWLWHKLKALLTVGCLEVVLKILWAEPDISQRLCTAQLWTTFQKCTSVVQNRVKPRNHIKHINHNHSILIVSNQKVRNKWCTYKDISFFFMRMAPQGVFYMSSRKCQRILYLGNKSMEERLKFWTNEQIEDPTIMTGQNVFHGLTKREELLLKNYLLEIPISSRRPIPIWSYQSSAPCPVQIVSPKTQLGFFYRTQVRLGKLSKTF